MTQHCLASLTFKRLTFALSATLALVLNGCGAMLGGADVRTLTLDQTPRAAVDALHQAHPAAQIDRIEAAYSNSPPLYRLHYHEAYAGQAEAEYRYSPYENVMSFMTPHKIIGSFKRLHPNGVMDNVEYFEDVAMKVEFFRVQFHTDSKAAQQECFDANGETCSADGSTTWGT